MLMMMTMIIMMIIIRYAANNATNAANSRWASDNARGAWPLGLRATGAQSVANVQAKLTIVIRVAHSALLSHHAVQSSPSSAAPTLAININKLLIQAPTSFETFRILIKTTLSLIGCQFFSSFSQLRSDCIRIWSTCQGTDVCN